MYYKYCTLSYTYTLNSSPEKVYYGFMVSFFCHVQWSYLIKREQQKAFTISNKQKQYILWALRTGSKASEAVLRQYLNQFYDKWKVLRICLVLLHVAPPLLFTVTLFPATPTNKLAVPSPSLKVYHCNKRDMRNLHKQNFTIVFAQDILFPLPQLFIHGNSRYRFPKRWNWPCPQGI